MQLQLPTSKTLGELVLKLHNQQQTAINDQLSQFMTEPLQFAILKILNTKINNSLTKLNNNLNANPQVYFQRDKYCISEQLRSVGLITKYIVPLCNFQNPIQNCLAEFNTQKFIDMLTFMNEVNDQLKDIMKAIFPRINVNKDNVPLYFPFYSIIKDYQCQVIGNPSWQMSRKLLEYFYTEKMKDQQKQIENWFLMLLGDKKILERFNDNKIRKIWSLFYCHYMEKTLQPYRYVKGEQQQNEIGNFENILRVVNEMLDKQKQIKNKILLKTLLFSLTTDERDVNHLDQLTGLIYEYLISLNKDDEKYYDQLSAWGLINSLIVQFYHNSIQLVQTSNAIKEIKQLNLFKLNKMINKAIQNVNLSIQSKVPHHYYYIRITYPNKISNQINKTNNQKKTIQIMQKLIQSDQQLYPFPQFLPFQQNLVHTFSPIYLAKYPSTIIDIMKYIPKQKLIWNLLSTNKLNHFQSFKTIQAYLQNNQKEIQISLDSQKIQQHIIKFIYEQFLEAWNTFHRSFDKNAQNNHQHNLEQQIIKVKRCKDFIGKIFSIKPLEKLNHPIIMPLDRSQNIMKIMDYMIKGFDQVIRTLPSDKSPLLSYYVQFLLSPNFKERISNVLNEQEKNQFWKKWSSVYLADQPLTNQLLGISSNKSQKQKQHRIPQRQVLLNIKENQINPSEVMQLQ